MTLADSLYAVSEEQLIEEVLLHLGIEGNDPRAKSIERGTRTIVKTAREGKVKGKNDYIIIAYKGFREGLPTCFVDLIAKEELVRFRDIPTWNDTLVDWIPKDNSLGKRDLQRLPFAECVELMAHSIDLVVMPSHIGENSFPNILTTEICPSTDNYLTHSTPALIIGRILKQKGFLYPDYGCSCDLLDGKWDIKALGTKTESLLKLMQHPNFWHDQLEMRDDLFNYISYYQALKNCMEYISKDEGE